MPRRVEIRFTNKDAQPDYKQWNVYLYIVWDISPIFNKNIVDKKNIFILQNNLFCKSVCFERN